MGGAKQNRRRCGRVTCCASEKWEGQGSPRRQEHNRLAQRRPQRARRVLPWLETLAGVFEAVCTGDVETPGKMEGHQRASSGLDTTMRQRGRYLRHCQLQALHACSQPGSCTRVCRTDVFFSTDGRAGRTCTVLAVPRPAKRSQLRWWQGAGAPPANLVRAQSIFDRCLSHTISPFTSSAACARSSVTVSYPKGGLSHRDPQRDGLMATRERRRRASRARPLRLSHSSSSSVSRPLLCVGWRTRGSVGGHPWLGSTTDTTAYDTKQTSDGGQQFLRQQIHWWVHCSSTWRANRAYSRMCARSSRCDDASSLRLMMLSALLSREKELSPRAGANS